MNWDLLGGFALRCAASGMDTEVMYSAAGRLFAFLTLLLLPFVIFLCWLLSLGVFWILCPHHSKPQALKEMGRICSAFRQASELNTDFYFFRRSFIHHVLNGKASKRNLLHRAVNLLSSLVFFVVKYWMWTNVCFRWVETPTAAARVRTPGSLKERQKTV